MVDPPQQEGAVYRFSACEIHLDRREVILEGAVQQIQPKVFDLLVYLIRNRTRVVDKDELLDHIWPGVVVTESSLSQAVRRARTVIGDSGRDQRLIKTVQRRGYRFTGSVDIEDAGGDSMARVGSEASPPAASVAVLPFARYGVGTEDDYFADGLAEELLDTLANVPALIVAARTSSFAFRDSDAPVSEIGRRLGVAYVVEGSVRRSRDRLRTTVRLIAAENDFKLFSKTFEHGLDDIFAMQDEVARAVLDALHVELHGAGRLPQGKVNPDAYMLYLQGRHAYREGTGAGFNEAERLLTESLELDPAQAAALDYLALVHLRRADLGLVPAAEGYALARAAIDEALDIDPDFAQALAHRAWIAMMHDWDFEAADKAIQQAFALQPNDPTVLGHAGKLALIFGRTGEAIAIREEVLARSLLERTSHHNLGNAYLYGGRFDEAQAMYARALTLRPDYPGGHFYRGLAFLLGGDEDNAGASFLYECDAGWRLQGTALLSHHRGEYDARDAALRTLESAHGEEMCFQIAEVHGFLGDTDAAFDWLERAYDVRDGGLLEIKADPLLVSLHDDPRWDALLNKIGIQGAGAT